ncbi:hypothetical protein [Streptomyces longwoodensis]|uniref:hypothetical protein n=1 Tax=Streptomyces longwoodensis TaxID=68231 RepID=UPI00224F5E75|nr:hypothetical protein [Streptomyces longwoodensis]MCX4997012.1 hypothetical protein [Streptomyces longwoodensis]
MTTDELDEGVSVAMTVRQWHLVDGGVDNEVSIAAVDGREDTVEVGRAVREAGWIQVAGWSAEVPGSGGWPPDDERATVTLTREQWRFVVRVLDEWESVEDAKDDEESWPELREVIVAGVGDASA